MAQSNQLIDTLKKLLRANGKTYNDVAHCLELSEASVKRLFSEKNISLKRLDRICQLLGLEISDLVREMQHQHKRNISSLSHEQEKEIADNLGLMLITVLVMNQWSLTEIISHYQFSETECIQYLAHLDRLHIIELQPGNKIKLLVSPNFKWLENGPIQQLFRQKIEAEYFRTTFEKKSENLIVLNGMLSDVSNAAFQRKMHRLAQEFDELSKADASLPIGERKGATMLIALRDWDYSELYGFYRRT